MPYKSQQELEKIRQETRAVVWPLVNDEKMWTLNSGTDLETTGLVYKGHHDKIGTVWKLEVIIHITPDQFYEAFIKRHEIADWVPNVSEYRPLESGDGTWDVVYSKTKAIATISSRDFVSVSFHERFDDGSRLEMTVATTHNDAPKNSGAVRGEYFPSGSYLKPLKDDPTKCLLVWTNNTDMKGFLLKSVINVFMAKFLLEFGEAVIAKSKKMAEANKIS